MTKPQVAPAWNALPSEPPGPPFNQHWLSLATKYLGVRTVDANSAAQFGRTVSDADGRERRIIEVAVLVVQDYSVVTTLPRVHGHGQNGHQDELHRPGFHFLQLI